MQQGARVRIVLCTVVIAVSTFVGSPGAEAQTAQGPEAGSSDWRQVSAGGAHTCGIRTTGRLYCWGDDLAGQLGDDGTNTDQLVPVEVAGNFTNWTSVSAGNEHTCGRRATGRLYCWGSNTVGQLGDASGGQGTTPVQVAGGATDWGSVTTGAGHSCGRTTSGRLFCWGADNDGQLGDDETTTTRTTPVEVFAP